MRCVSNDKGTEIGMFPKIGVPPNHPCDFRIFHDFPLSTIQRAWGTLMAMETFSFYIKQVHFMTYGFHLCWDLLGCIQLNQVFFDFSSATRPPQSIERSPKKCSWACAKMVESKQSMAKMVGKRIDSLMEWGFRHLATWKFRAQNGAIFTPICSHFSSRMGATKQGSVWGG